MKLLTKKVTHKYLTGVIIPVKELLAQLANDSYELRVPYTNEEGDEDLAWVPMDGSDHDVISYDPIEGNIIVEIGYESDDDRIKVK